MNMLRELVQPTSQVGPCPARFDQFFACRVTRPNPEVRGYSLYMGAGYMCKHGNGSGFAQS